MTQVQSCYFLIVEVFLMKEYLKLIHDFEIKQTIERACFEIELTKKIFNQSINVDFIFNDLSSMPIFSVKEKKYILKEVTKKVSL